MPRADILRPAIAVIARFVTPVMRYLFAARGDEVRSARTADTATFWVRLAKFVIDYGESLHGCDA